jgi:RNA polymerase sigma-70 factor (ECF subfamily)
MPPVEAELKSLMIAGLDGDATAHRLLLEQLSRLLRGYYRRLLSRIGRSATEAEEARSLRTFHRNRDRPRLPLRRMEADSDQ